MIRISLTILTLGLGLSAQGVAPRAPALWAILKERCTCRGLVLELGDVAEVAGTDPALARRAARIPLGPTPEPGRTRLLTQASLADLLARDDHRIALRGADRVEISAEVVTLAAEDLATLARRHWLRTLGGGDASARLVSARIPEDLVCRAGRFRTTWRPRLLPDGPRAGRIPVHVDAVVDGEVTASRRVDLLVHRRTPVVIAARAVAPGRRLEPQDLRVEERDTADAGTRTLGSIAATAGRIATRRLSPGEVLSPGDARQPPVVLRGDEIRLVARTGSLTVKTSGTALGDGAPGERIKVRTGKRRRVVTAVVVDSKTASLQMNPARGGNP